MRPFFSGSSLARAMACPASEALPRTTSAPGDDAARGTAIHAYLASVAKLGRDAALDAVPEPYRDACAAIGLESLPVDGAAYAAEVAFAYNVDTGAARELGRGVTRDQAVALYATIGPSEVPLTVDVVGVGADGRGVYVADYKTGWLRQRAARDHAQLKIGALAAARAYRRTAATVQLIQLRDHGPPIIDTADLDEFELDAFGGAVAVAAAAVRHARQVVAAGGVPDVASGDHCRHCPAFTACPAMRGLVHAVAHQPVSWREDVGGHITPATARAAYDRWKLAKSALDKIGDVLAAYAIETGGFDVGDGLTYGPVTTKREHVDGAVARKVLTAMHGPEIADAACEWSTSKAAIEQALRKVVQDRGGKISHLQRDALDAIRAAGGVDVKVSTTLKEHRPKLIEGDQ